MTVSDDLVLSERRGNILLITINRPHVKNAVDGETAKAISAQMDLLDSTDDLFAGIITGAGGDFSAGADLKAGGSRATERGGFGVFKRPPRKPLVAAVEGVAVGGGFELCLASDLIVAASNARFGLPEVRHNVVAVGGGLFRLPRRIPYSIAMELALTAELKAPEYFAPYGLFNRIVEPGSAVEQAFLLLESVLKNGPTALAATKEIMFQSGEWSESEAWNQQLDVAKSALESSDREEGIRAFMEKRRPVWKGH